jgi:excisionase family DNA binding protein
MMHDEVPILRPGEAARLLGLRLSQLRHLEAAGRLVTVRTLGGHRRYRQDDVLALQRWMQRRSAVA